MEDDLQYVDLTPAELPGPGPRAEAGGEGVLYVQDGVVQGPAGEQYVTIMQNGQAYAIPTADYAAMLSQPDMEPGSQQEKNNQSTEAKKAEAVLDLPSEPPLVVSSQPLCPVTAPPPAPPVLSSSESVSVSKGPGSLPPVLPKPAKHSAAGPEGPGMTWMTKSAPEEKTKKKIFTSKESPRKYLYPTIQEVIKKLPEQNSPKKNYKPIRVDNWGIFLLSRLQNYFQKKEFCDMTLRFPSKNAQIKVHKLIINACTDYFSQLENEGKMTDGAIDMPANFTPETLAPIIRFMYTGKIELKEATYKKLYETADTLQMGVLTKLMDAQVNAPESEVPPSEKKNVKRKNSGAFEEDPVEQMRKIRRIEKRVALEGKRSLRQAELEGPRLPGKKLPIWKRKLPDVTPPVSSVSTTVGESLEDYKIPKNVDSTATTGPTEANELLASPGEEEVTRRPIKIEPLSGQLLPSPVVGATYKKRSPGEKPKIPRKLQEIQQHLMFEKVLKSGTKNTVMKKEVKSEQSKDLSIDEVKELMQEQKQRMAAITTEDEGEENEFDYNDYNDDDDYIDNIDSPAPLPETSELTTVETEETKPVSGPAVLAEPEPQKKTIRFSHTPTPTVTPTPSIPVTPSTVSSLSATPVSNGKSAPTGPAAATAIKSKPLEFCPVDPASQRRLKLVPVSQVECFKNKTNIVTNLQPPLAARNELDEALEEFSRVAEEEAEELGPEGEQEPQAGTVKTPGQDPKKPRRGRPPRWLKEQTLQMGAQARTNNKPAEPADRQLQQQREEEAGGGIDLKHSQEAGEGSNEEAVGNQAQVINEVLKKHPNLLRDNKAVKVKIMTKDPATGKSVTKFITLKAQQNEQTPEPVRTSSPGPGNLGGFKPLQKVMYTGKRGRPKKVKPGDYDPHQEERRKIEARLKRDYPHLANQLASSGGVEEELEEEESDEEVVEEEGLAEQQFSSAEPNIPQSSEAETLSTVANGLAASLGMSQQAGGEGAAPALMGGNISSPVAQFQPGQALVMENGQIILTQAAPLVSVESGQSGPGDFIQILTSDGQLQHFALAKNKIQTQPIQAQPLSQPLQTLQAPPLGSLQPQQFSFLPSQPLPSLAQTSNTARIVASTAPGNINIQHHHHHHQAMADIHSVNPSLMSLAPAPLLYNTSTASTSQQSVYPASNTTETDRGVNKTLVSDWDSEEDCQD